MSISDIHLLFSPTMSRNVAHSCIESPPRREGEDGRKAAEVFLGISMLCPLKCLVFSLGMHTCMNTHYHFTNTQYGWLFIDCVDIYLWLSDDDDGGTELPVLKRDVSFITPHCRPTRATVTGTVSQGKILLVVVIICVKRQTVRPIV